MEASAIRAVLAAPIALTNAGGRAKRGSHRVVCSCRRHLRRSASRRRGAGRDLPHGGLLPGNRARLPGEIAERAWTTATRVFDLPPEDKLSVARPATDYPYG